MSELIDWIILNPEWLTLFLALIPIVWGASQYLWIKRSEVRQREFENYHSLIKQLVEGESPDAVLKIDRQMAVVFELRNYAPYFEVSIRILKGLQKTWGLRATQSGFPRLLSEIQATISYMEGRPRRWFHR